jgi:hypothetical protein
MPFEEAAASKKHAIGAEKHAETGGAEITIKTSVFRARKMLDFRRFRRLPGSM